MIAGRVYYLQGWEDQQNHRDHHFDGCLVRFFLGALAAFDAHLVGLHAQDFRQADTELVGLNDGGGEAGYVWHLDAVGHIAQGFTANLAELDFTQYAPEGNGEVVIPLLIHFAHRLVEAQTGFHADRQQVKRIGQRLEDAILATGDLAAQEHDGQKVAQQGGNRGIEQGIRVTGWRHDEEHHEGQQRQGDGQGDTHGKEGGWFHRTGDIRLFPAGLGSFPTGFAA